MTTMVIKDNSVQINQLRNQSFAPVMEPKKKYKKPDDDFYRAITMKEFKKRALVMMEKIDKMYTKK